MLLDWAYNIRKDRHQRYALILEPEEVKDISKYNLLK